VTCEQGQPEMQQLTLIWQFHLTRINNTRFPSFVYRIHEGAQTSGPGTQETIARKAHAHQFSQFVRHFQLQLQRWIWVGGTLWGDVEAAAPQLMLQIRWPTHRIAICNFIFYKPLRLCSIS